MVSIKTISLRKQADMLHFRARRLNYQLKYLESIMLWMKRQEFSEAHEVYHSMIRQYEALGKQKQELLLLEEALRRVCDKYDRTEQRIIESEEKCLKIRGYVNIISLSRIREQLRELGMHMTNQ